MYNINNINQYIGNKIRARRKNLSWSAEKLGKKMGLSQQQISRYEHGTQNISLKRLYHLSLVMECNLHYFVSSFTPIETSQDTLC